MTDIASILSPLAQLGAGPLIDIGLDATGDLAADDTLESAVIISLATDRQAMPGDPIPDGDPRAWWGNMPFDQPNPPPANSRIGSRLWLLRRTTASAETLRLAKLYCEEALSWMIQDGVAARIDVTTAWRQGGNGLMDIRVTIYRQSGLTAAPSQFDFIWNSTLGA